jgi:hypothetical protein
MKMPIYLQHAACCLLWKKYIYVVGGELKGKWSPNCFKLDLKTLKFNEMSQLNPVIKMASLAPLSSDLISGVFIAGLETLDGF